MAPKETKPTREPEPGTSRGHAGLALLLLLPILGSCGGGGGGNSAAPLPQPPPTQPPPSQPPPSEPPPSQPGGLNPAAAPSENFDLSHWKLTLPTGLEIKTFELNKAFQLANVFFTDPQTGGMVFRTPNIGGTTAGSSFSRTELREMLAPSSPAYADVNNWTPEQGGLLQATLRVDHVSTTGDAKMVGRVIIGQIHAFNTEVVRLYFDKKPHEAKGRIYAAMEDTAGATTRPAILGNTGGSGIALGERFSYEISLQGLQLDVTIIQADGQRHALSRTIDPNYAGRNVYFKAGVYNQNNTGEVTDYAQATFFRLSRSH